MAAPKATVWELEPHTRAKHEILKRYLQAWTAMLGQSEFPKVLYIDGFAGPGRYSGGEKGSPIIALKAALAHKDKIKTRIDFRFIELDRERAAVLEEIVTGIEVPDNFHIEFAPGQTFEAAFAEIHGSYKAKLGKLPPTFAFIDPSGWKGVPFSTVRTIMSYRSCEVFVNFIYEEVNRFIAHPDQEANFDSFFGTTAWRHCMSLNDPRHRNRFLHDLYLSQLRTVAGAKFVRSFQMRNDRDVTDYYLFYATNNLLGLKKMKEAMWTVDKLGEFTFSDATDPNQLILFAKEPRFEELKSQFLNQFRGREATVGEVEEFVLTETAFRETHYKTKVLRPLELADPPGLKVIDPPRGRRRGTYRDASMRLRFL